ncbi:type II toxin-antitoxin system VapC family toxin [Aurantimonas coralicida]|uniref:type II toxin-antitoxin system VapC family toxin n=1 Tax=Aurantimonas coralicida TaxID=182270 RepID=UPI001E57017D|nr:type II toxin-antitoxin system VapC family toxin [Aurantimonas coralicida]MCD1643149.1 type II toxin-antitoxin system VapC family toxin [Aurantimonas coralicida]
MFIDASAICAILAGEADAVQLSARMDRHDRRLTSALAIWEASVALSRIRGVDPQIAQRMIDEFLGDQSVRIVAIEPETAAIAIDAYARYGKGRHPAALNFGDCFAYACARHFDVPLLYKGNDFARTDIGAA